MIYYVNDKLQILEQNEITEKTIFKAVFEDYEDAKHYVEEKNKDIVLFQGKEIEI